VSTRAARPRRAAATAGGALALSVWVRLLKAHGLALRQVRRQVPEGLTLPQFDVLVQLHRRGAGMTPGELTHALLVTAGNVTGIVGRLVAMDLTERHPVPEDRRAVRVRLTPRGRRLMRRVIPRHRRDVAALLSGVSPADLGRLRDLLGRLGRALERQP
jgi:DNA-binding MarR family transcriptional regulator